MTIRDPDEFYTPFKGHVDAPSHEFNWTYLEEWLNRKMHGGGIGGPIEPSYLVAAVNARAEIKAVADFVCDGVDDDIEIQAAIDLIDDSAANGGTVFLSAGDFECSESLDIDQMRIVGEGPISTWVYATDIGVGRHGAFVINGGRGVLSNLYLECTDTDDSHTTTTVFLNGGHMDNCGIGISGGTAQFCVEIMRGSTVRDCWLASTDAIAGIRVLDFGNTDGCKVIGNHISRMDSGFGIKVEDGVPSDTGIAEGTIVIGNYIGAGPLGDEDIGGPGIYAGGIDGVYVGNVVQGVTGDGIEVVGDRNSIVANNVTDVSGDGIVLTAAADSNVVDGNTFNNVTGADITDGGTNTKVGAYVGDVATSTSIDQSSTTGAVPVLTVDQADVDEDFFKFIGTSDTNVDRALVDAADFTTPGTIAGWLKINVQDDQGTNPITDGDFYIPFYTAPTA